MAICASIFGWSLNLNQSSLQNIWWVCFWKITGLQGHHHHHCPWHVDDQTWLCLLLVQHSSWGKWKICSSIEVCSANLPFQEIFEIRLCHLSSKLTCLGHLAQHCLNLNLRNETRFQNYLFEIACCPFSGLVSLIVFNLALASWSSTFII